MAVFTSVSLDELAVFLKDYDLGTAKSIKGISSGIENSNFFITTTTGEYVLTLFEQLSEKELPYYLKLMLHLAKHGIKVADPIPNRSGDVLGTLCYKPTAIVHKLEGRWIEFPEPYHCKEVGAMMAKMHLAGQDYPLSQPNLRGVSWWIETAPKVSPYLSQSLQMFLQQELDLQIQFTQSRDYSALPKGPIHADLFRNNVMFQGAALSGFFDFYFAGNDTWLFDVAVAVNDWCIDLATGAFDQARLKAYLNAYQSVRVFTPEEQRSWQTILRAAALRFWISRLFDFYLPRKAEMLKPHDPTHFERILRLRSQHVDAL